MLETIAFDADDTLWHNETLYNKTQEKLRKLLSSYQEPEWVDERLYETEMKNLGYYGYGIKGFTLSMIETAIQLSDGRIQGREIQAIIDYAKEMVQAPVRLLDQVEAVLAQLSPRYGLMIITKGDLFDQESKVARSGLAAYFDQIEILTEKSEESYRAVLDKHAINPDHFLMVGNSLRSDILPVLAIGGRAVHVPYHITWAHETIEKEKEQDADYYEIEHLGLLPDLLDHLI